ncbi:MULTISPECIES: M20 family metallo-hydrolase [Bacillus]|uniref:Zn-dependent hydrolase n=1 Tax=Bacillus glycinifermentans TaxID=1664069 RepID=A0AAJ3YXT9_9BACI|nr:MULTISPECIES: M20 family metallo-hydrolase [Bacillus]KKB73865.1 hypothetical protein TH62_10280 [Bacillus sp. TH008]MDU0071988.1 M20 family metallo-hydrolase [Bacillus sp. IG6]MED8019560.1 M20 family metallo-hydrolase [Bacillus glycinifermentans]QAT64996.1 Zn-dependent hydrolase [Bacillus glycinifermentans]WKB78966.1 M20 family metallo-hydrolase [Bacillus glycinifermentans]
MEAIDINPLRLTESLREMSMIGKSENGGISRLALTDEDRRARLLFKSWCEELGMDVRVDDLGNMYAAYEGLKDEPPILIGSHLDTVENGGAYDGAYGLIAGLEAVRVLVESGKRLTRPVELVNFTNEEGARFEPSMLASGVLAGRYAKEEAYAKTDRAGTSFLKALEDTGFKGEQENRIRHASCYIELHVEQGPVLERSRRQIGIVEGVAGLTCVEIAIKGTANHAGTTPMVMRNDALVTASNVISRIPALASSIDDGLTATVGRFSVKPNIYNVIPGEAVFTVDVRHIKTKIREEAVLQISRLAEAAAGEAKAECAVKVLWKTETALFSKGMLAAASDAVCRLGYSSRRMFSGAGHDAQYIASLFPSLMLFIPCAGGKSHCPEEYSSPEDCARGAAALLQTVLLLDNQYVKEM